MANLPNQYAVPSLPNLDPQTNRVIQDLAARVNYLTTELDRVRGDTPGLMTAKAEKENPQSGIIIIPSPSGDGFIRVSKDGVIQSYGNPASMIGVPVVIHVNTTVVGNVGGGTDTLHSFTVEPGTLLRDGDLLEIEYAGTLQNAGTNNRFISNTVNGVTLENASGTTFTPAGNIQWRMFLRIIRISPTSVLASSNTLMGFLAVDNANALNSFGIGFASFNRMANISVSNLGTTAFILVSQGQGTNNDDVVQKSSVIKLIKMS